MCIPTDSFCSVEFMRDRLRAPMNLISKRTAALDAFSRPLPTQIFVRFQVISLHELSDPPRPAGRPPPPPGLLRITPSLAAAAAAAASGTSRSALLDCCRLQWRLRTPVASPPVRTANSATWQVTPTPRTAPSAVCWRATASRGTIYFWPGGRQRRPPTQARNARGKRRS